MELTDEMWERMQRRRVERGLSPGDEGLRAWTASQLAAQGPVSERTLQTIARILGPELRAQHEQSSAKRGRRRKVTQTG